MQRMRSDVSPKTIQPNFRRRRSCPSHLKNPARDFQRRICGHHLHARNPLSYITSLVGRDVTLSSAVVVDVGDLLACHISQRFSGAEMRKEGAIMLKNIWL